MSFNISNNSTIESTIPKISVIGVGGAGINAVNNMILSQLDSVKFIAANTDCQNLMNSLAETKIQLGSKCTKGKGAGSNPEVGKQAAEEASEEIKRELTGIDMLFIASGMGGGTGTGASPVIAKMAKDMGILTIAIVIKPFIFEGKKRMQTAIAGVERLEQIVDALIVIENQKLMEMNNVSMVENYAIADGILRQAVYCVVSVLLQQGFINRDFADVKTVLSSAGRAVIGYGEDVDAKIATDTAIHNQVLENNCIKGAKNMLINITGSKNLKPADIQDIIEIIRNEAKITDEDEPNVIFGFAVDEELGNNVRVSVIATGIEKENEELLTQNNDEYNDMKCNTNEEYKNLDVETQKIEATVFIPPLDESDLENDESFNITTEEIPQFTDNNALFKTTFFPTAKEKKKMNKIEFEKRKINEHGTRNDDINDKNSNQRGLFEDNRDNGRLKTLSFFSKIMNSKIIKSIGNVPEIDIVKNEDITNCDGTSDEEIYNISSIKRRA